MLIGWRNKEAEIVTDPWGIIIGWNLWERKLCGVKATGTEVGLWQSERFFVVTGVEAKGVVTPGSWL